MSCGIELPYNWDPRWYQQPAWDAMDAGIKRLMLLWHRRAGKDDFCMHRAAVEAHKRVGNYWHMLPEYSQARKSVWDAVNPHTGVRRIDEAFPVALRENTRDTDMFIRFKSGSTWQLVGSDTYDSLVGSPPIGVTASEWALANPAAWAYLRPILRENGGWAVFITTPRGRNHAHRMFEGAKDDPDWFVQRLTARETKTLTAAELEKERQEYLREYGADDGDNLFSQEYLCDFDAAIIGAYYSRAMRQAAADNRVCRVPYDSTALVHTAWDLGLSDSTAIWFVQVIGREVRLIDYLENAGQPLDWYVAELGKKGYSYGQDILPHDAKARELQTGRSREETLRALGRNVQIAPSMGVADGINAVRTILSRCWFDEDKTAKGRDCLAQYRRQWDEERKIYQDRPYHDWTSHGADAFRYLALCVDGLGNESWGGPLKYKNLRVA